MYKLIFYVPPSHLEQVKDACFKAGAGRYKNYDKCSWQTLGKGQFRPLNGSRPFSGKINEIESVEEFFVEMIVERNKAKAVVEALIYNHPYEEVAYQLLEFFLLDDITKPNK